MARHGARHVAYGVPVPPPATPPQFIGVTHLTDPNPRACNGAAGRTLPTTDRVSIVRAESQGSAYTGIDPDSEAARDLTIFTASGGPATRPTQQKHPQPAVTGWDLLKGRRNARAALGLPPADAPGGTCFSIQALSLATRHLAGGRQRFLAFVYFAVLDGDPTAQQWWSTFAGLGESLRPYVALDDVCQASGIGPSRLMSIIVPIAMDHGKDVGRLVAAVAHPAVIAKSVERATAQLNDSFEDRELLLQAAGFAPVPRGTSITIDQSMKVDSSHKTLVGGTNGWTAAGTGAVPAFLDDTDGLAASRASVQRALAEAVEQERVELPASHHAHRPPVTIDAQAQAG